MDLNGRRVLITGGRAGMGRFMATTFARAGAAVHIADIDMAALDEVRGAIPGLTGPPTDITDEDAVARLVADAVAAISGLDTLIHNAGIPGPTASVEDVDPADWRRTLDVDITGMFLVTCASVPTSRPPRAARS